MNDIRMERAWAMPCAETFSIEPIATLLGEEVGARDTWVDPFARNNSWGNITNDINTDTAADSHMDALEFLRHFKIENEFDGALFDPPYNLSQLKECYTGNGAERYWTADKCRRFWADCKDELARIVKPGGKVICFGWSSVGMTRSRRFFLRRLLLVCHGGEHYDTIVTVWEKSKEQQQHLFT